MNYKAKIAKLEVEVSMLKQLSRVRREPNKGFGGVVQKLREARGMGPIKLSQYSGLKRAYITQIETIKNPNPSLKSIESIARGLGISATRLMSEYEGRK